MTRDPAQEKKRKSSYRIVRGGGWLYSPDNLLSNHRDGISPGNRSDSVGLRLVRTSKEKP
jgi:formylglycine-generating enzyme required for sulfatase activity